MNFREDALYSIVVPTSMGVRLSPLDLQPIHVSSAFRLQATSAESNAISLAAALGLRVKVLTIFVKDSPIATFIKNDLMRRHIEYEGPEIPQGGPWGYRHQINIADSGFGLRAPHVQNDRAGEVGRELSVEDFDLHKLFVSDGVKLIHISGLVAAISPKSAKFCIELAKMAKANGTKISFDLNYRSSFWEGRKEELRKTFREIAHLADILIGNEEDFQLALGVEGPSTGGQKLNDNLSGFRLMIEKLYETYTNVEIFGTTLREVIDANEHLWGAVLSCKNQWYSVEPRKIRVLDRIGGGDGFVGGFLYGLLKEMEIEDALHFGWANGALTSTLLTDFSEPINENQVWGIWEGNARVRR